MGEGELICLLVEFGASKRKGEENQAEPVRREKVMHTANGECRRPGFVMGSAPHPGMPLDESITLKLRAVVVFLWMFLSMTFHPFIRLQR